MKENLIQLVMMILMEAMEEVEEFKALETSEVINGPGPPGLQLVYIGKERLEFSDDVTFFPADVNILRACNHLEGWAVREANTDAMAAHRLRIRRPRRRLGTVIGSGTSID